MKKNLKKLLDDGFTLQTLKEPFIGITCFGQNFEEIFLESEDCIFWDEVNKEHIKHDVIDNTILVTYTGEKKYFAFK